MFWFVCGGFRNEGTVIELPRGDGAAFEHLEQSNGRSKTEETLDWEVELDIGFALSHRWTTSIVTQRLSAQDIEQNRGPKRMAHERYLSFETRVPLLEKCVDPVAFLEYGLDDVFAVCR